MAENNYVTILENNLEANISTDGFNFVDIFTFSKVDFKFGISSGTAVNAIKKIINYMTLSD